MVKNHVNVIIHKKNQRQCDPNKKKLWKITALYFHAHPQTSMQFIIIFIIFG